MKIMVRNLLLILGVVLFTGCSAQPTAVIPQVLPATQAPPEAAPQAAPAAEGINPYAPQPGDETLVRGDVTVEGASLTRMDLTPPHMLLNFSFFAPSPCHQLRVEVAPPNTENRIDVSAYGLATDQPCGQEAIATSLPASVDLGNLPPGHYSVWLNGAVVGEFDM